MKRVLCIILSVLLLASLSLPAAAASSKATTMALDSTSGTVTVKNAAGTAQTVRSGLRLYSGYSVSTALSSYAYISLDSSKVVKLDASSELSVQKSGKKLELQLSSGNLVFDVSAPLAGSESLNIRTSTMVTGVRGTSAEISVKSLTLDFKAWTLKEADGRRVYSSPDGKESVEVEANGAVSYRNGDVVIPVRKGTGVVSRTSAAGAAKTPEELAGSLSFQVTEIRLLSGTLEIHPLGLYSEVKTVVLHAGEQVSSLDAYVPEKLAPADLSGSALTFLEENSSLQERILTEGIYSEEELEEALASAEEKLAEEQAAAAEEKAAVDAAEKKTVKSADQVFTDSYEAVAVAAQHQIVFDTTGAGYEWLDSAGTPVTSAMVADGADYTFSIRIKDGYRIPGDLDPEVFASVGAVQQELDSEEDGSFILSTIAGDMTVTTNTAMIEADDSVLTLPADATWENVRSALYLATVYDTIIITPDADALPDELTADVSKILPDDVMLVLRPGVSLTVPASGLDTAFENNGSVFINSGASFTVNGNVLGYGTLSNEGTLTVAESGSLTFNDGGGLTNQGTIFVNGEMQTAATMYNYETMTVNGTFEATNVLNNFGTFTISAGGSFENSPSGSFDNNGTLNVNGSVRLDGPLNNTAAGTMTLNGTVTVDNATGELDNYGTLTVNGLLENSGRTANQAGGSFIIAEGGTVRNGGTGSVFGVNENVENNGTFTNYIITEDSHREDGTVAFGDNPDVRFENNGTFEYWDDSGSAFPDYGGVVNAFPDRLSYAFVSYDHFVNMYS